MSQILLLLGRPYETPRENLIYLIIEISVSVYLYFLVMLTDFQEENRFRDIQGWALAGIISVIVGVNSITLLINKIRSIFRLIKDFTSSIKKKLTVPVKPPITAEEMMTKEQPT